MNGKTKWTIMVYVGADENLANFAIESLKQLRRSASPDVVVAAQLDLEGSNHPRELHRYIFDGSNRSEPLSANNERCWASDEQRSLVMTEPRTLTTFVDWVYGCERCNDADHYCLILWGHGPQLLFEAPAAAEAAVNNGGSRASELSAGNGTDDQARQKPGKLYFTPVQLRKALEETELVKQRKLDVIAMDACSMSTIEFAYELQHLADFMVASQEDVPPFSFPYATLVDQFRNATSPQDLGQRSVLDYAQAYEEHVCIPHAGMKKVTLSCLDLDKINMIAGPLRNLADALNAGARFKSVSDAIFAARKNAKAFVGGLFVDIHSFCEQLLDQLSADNIYGEGRERLWGACETVCNAIAPRQTEHACIIANQTVDERCHGLSVYFPYMQNEQQGEQPRVQDRKGGRDTGGKGGGVTQGVKGGLDVPIKGTDTQAWKGGGVTQGVKGGRDAGKGLRNTGSYGEKAMADSGGTGPKGSLDTGRKGPGAEQDTGGKGANNTLGESGTVTLGAKGGRDTAGKGGLDALNKGGLDTLNKGGVDTLNKGGIDLLSKGPGAEQNTRGKGADNTLGESGTEALGAKGGRDTGGKGGLDVPLKGSRTDVLNKGGINLLTKGPGGDTIGKGAGGSQGDSIGKGLTFSHADTLGKGAGSQGDTIGKGLTYSRADILGKGAGGSQGDSIGKGPSTSQVDVVGKGAGGPQGNTIGKGLTISHPDVPGKGAGGSQGNTIGKGLTIISHTDVPGKGAGGPQATLVGKGLTISRADVPGKGPGDPGGDTIGKGLTISHADTLGKALGGPQNDTVKGLTTYHTDAPGKGPGGPQLDTGKGLTSRTEALGKGAGGSQGNTIGKGLTCSRTDVPGKGLGSGSEDSGKGLTCSHTDVPGKGIGSGEDSGKGLTSSRADASNKGAGGPQGDTIGKGFTISHSDFPGKGASGPGGDFGAKGPGGSQQDTGKGIAARYGLSPASVQNLLRAALQKVIRDTEEYYRSDEFEFSGKTGWYEFVAGQWSRILAEREPEDLDVRYSAHQCALNLLRRGERAQGEHDDEEARVAEVVAD